MNQRTGMNDGRRWVIAILTAFAFVAVVLSITVIRTDAPSRVTHVDGSKPCVSTAADDAHASLEAFFQNPSGNDVLKQASLSCSK
ncbi:hypothetical protein [Trinickia sp. EG282A]|uniref:hypothetical protein n=1 Tax=Trinickia sp. EG282A TaxID=3237013 RepID=UPI0034D3011F